MDFITKKNILILLIALIFLFSTTFLIFNTKNYVFSINMFSWRPNVSQTWRYYISNFIGKSYSNELLILITVLGLLWWGSLYVYFGVNPIYRGWPHNYIYYYGACQRLFIFHFLSFIIGLKIFNSWLAFRYAFVFYIFVEIVSFCFKFEFIARLSYKFVYYFWHSTDWFFGVKMLDVNFFSILFHFAVALIFVLFFAIVFYGFCRNNLPNLPFINTTDDLLKFFKSSNFDSSVKNAFFTGFNFFFVRRSSFFAFFAAFYVWTFTFGGFAHVAETIFFGPYFLVKILWFIVKIITFNYYLPLFVVWSTLFHLIYFWFKDIKTIGDSLLFFEYIYVYYAAGKGESADFKTRLKNAIYLFIVFVIPFSFILDVSFVSFFINFYLFFIIEIHFWTISSIMLCFIYILVLLIMPNNDPDHPQANARLFCQWIFNLSLLLSLFFLNLTVLYACNSYNVFVANYGVVDGKIFTSLSSTIDFAWVNMIGLPLTDFLPNYCIGIFTFGYDYFALVLCLASCLIFSLIFLTSIFSASLTRKRYFFFNLLCIELCVLFSFLNLNLLGFFVFFESSLVPMFIIIGLWGSSDRRWFAAKQMLFYSLTASTPMIVCIVHLYLNYGSLDYAFLYGILPFMSFNEKFFFWLSLFLMFATKIPMFPFHSWLLNAHVEAPTGGSIILAAILLKLGVFGIVRYLLQFLGEISAQMAPAVISLALIGVLYSSVCAITELDCKRLIAHTSIAHMNLAVIGLFIFDERGLIGAVYLSIGHVVTSAALFFLIGTLYDRFHTRNLFLFGGLVQLMPIFSSFLFFFVMANSGFPWTLSFAGEFLLLAGVSRKLSLLVYFILIISSVCLLYANLRLFMFICFGTVNKNLIHNATSDLTFLELYCSALLSFNGFILMWNSDLFFFALLSDNIVRIIF